MSDTSLNQSTTPEQLATQVSSLIDRASHLAPEDLVLRDSAGHRNELQVGEGYLSSLRKPSGDTVNMGVAIIRETEGKFPARTVIRKENGLGVLIVAVEDDEAQPEGTFDAQKVGRATVELDSKTALSATTAVLSTLEGEIAKREAITPDNLDTLLRA